MSLPQATAYFMTKRVAGCRSPGGSRLGPTSLPVVIDEPHLHEAGRRMLRRCCLPRREPGAINTISGGDSGSLGSSKAGILAKIRAPGPSPRFTDVEAEACRGVVPKKVRRKRNSISDRWSQRGQSPNVRLLAQSVFSASLPTLYEMVPPSLSPCPSPFPFHKHWGVSHVSGAPVAYSPSPSLQRATRGHLRAEQRGSAKRVVQAPAVLPSALTLSPGWHLPGAGPPGPTQGLGQEGSPAGLVWAKVRWLLSIIPTEEAGDPGRAWLLPLGQAPYPLDS